MQIGACHVELGNPDGAFAAYQGSEDVRSRPTARRWMRWRRRTRPRRTGPRGWRNAASSPTIAEPEEKPGLEEEIGDAYADKLSDAERAEACYRAALELEPGAALHAAQAARRLHQVDKRWQPAIDLLNQLAKTEEDPAVRARTLYTAALILRDELNLPDEAASLLERCLDEAPDMTVAFEDLEALHKAKSDWKALAHSYRRMVKRLPTEAPHRAPPQPVDAAGRHRDQASCTIASWR